MATTYSKTKVEQKAITKLRVLLDDIEFIKYNFQECEKDISWDGTIDLYNGNIDLKTNYDGSIDVQIKGRTTPNKKLNDKHAFNIDRADVENFKKKDGTLFLLCLFKKDGTEYKIYYANLLPYNIKQLLEQYSGDKIRVEMRTIKSSDHFENICRNFKINKRMQKGISEKIFSENNLSSEDGKVTKFYLWEKDIHNFKPQDLVGTWQYFYTLDKNGYTVGITYGELLNIVENLNFKAYTKSKEIIFEDVQLDTSAEYKRSIFGKAFSFDFKSKKFNISICGTLSQRIKQLEFTKYLFQDLSFFINEHKFSIVSPPEDEIERFNALLDKYNFLNSFFKKHNINVDINFDTWDNCDFEKLYIWIGAFERKYTMSLHSDISMMGKVEIKDLKFSVFADKLEDGKFDIYSLWNCNKPNKFYFYDNSSDDKITTKNIYLVLNSDAYQSNDINYEEMKESFSDQRLSDGEYELMNLQVLEVLKAFDIIKDKQLLSYAKYLVSLLMKYDSKSPVYFINYCQILKREGTLVEKEMQKLIEIRDTNDMLELKICCNLLLENTKEANILLNRLDSKTIEIFRKFPISIYL